ncbi:MAG: Gfo/Idh/MocA family oxidoreductase [Clostridia bacterium]|nr:Gfo/Idh/MocA family oxidoreductase [Clostridia bacterium]
MSDFKMSERKLWKVAVIGCGAFANWEYLPNIRSEANADIVAAVDIIPERAQKACEDYNISNWYKSVFELIENCDFDIAIDAASIQAHHEINMAVLSAGKHLITQKPAAPSVELLDEQIALADKNNVKMVCVPIHPMRYDLNIAKQMIKDNVIGTPYYAKCNVSHGGPEYFQYRNADPTFFFEPGAGALVDMGVHGLQIVTSVFGAAKKIMCMAKVTTPERIVRSGAYNGKVIKTDKIPDQYIISLDFGGNKMALVDTGFSQKASKAPQLEIFGDKGTISFTKPYMKNPIPDVYMDCPEKGIRGWVSPMEWENPPQKLNSQCCCLKDLIDAIENNKKPLLSAEHARHILEIMCKIPEAAESGKTIELETSF